MVNLIGLVGYMGSGKTTVAEYLVQHHRFERVAFADALKELAVQVTPDRRIDKARDRALLQVLGTLYREHVDANHWVKLYTEYVHSQLERCHSIITDDVRYPNELDAIKNLGGYLVFVSTPQGRRLERLQARDGQAVEGIKNHSSESNVDKLKNLCDDVIVNDRDLDDLHSQINRILHYLHTGQKAA